MRARSNLTYSDDYVEYCRETAGRVKNLQDLALRGRNKQEITRLIHERIVEVVGLQAGDDLVDIGCGDGTLLAMAERIGVNSALGLLATEEEVALLRPAGFRVRQGLTNQLPVGDASASVVVCNNVLLVVPREKIPASLREIYRIASPERASWWEKSRSFKILHRTQDLIRGARRYLISTRLTACERGLECCEEWRIGASWEGSLSYGTAPQSLSMQLRKSSSLWPKPPACTWCVTGSMTIPTPAIIICCEKRVRRRSLPPAERVWAEAGGLSPRRDVPVWRLAQT